MEYTASHKHSFKWALTDDRLHYDIPDFSFDSKTTPILLRIKGLKKKHLSKNTAKYKDFTKPKCTSSGFFFSQSDFALKEF